MSNNFCKFLSNQVRIEYGQLRPCCWFKESVDLYDSTAASTYLQRLENITSWSDTNGNCNECYSRESKGLYSPRLESFEIQRFKQVHDNTKISIEIQIDKDCNAACLICGPWNSTTWEKYNLNENRSTYSITHVKNDTSRFMNVIKSKIDFSSATSVLFLGGEPLKTKSHLEFLKLIKNPSQTTIKYITNCSYRPDEETLEVWSRFNQVIITASIDGIGEHFNYLRWPLQWHQVESNIMFFLSNPTSNIKMPRFSYTTTPLSIWYHDRYVSWAKTTFNNAETMFDRPWQPQGQTPMALSAIPELLQSAIKEKYGPGHEISRLLVPFDTTQYRTFMSYISQHDYRRQISWKTTFPEMAEYFK